MDHYGAFESGPVWDAGVSVSETLQIDGGLRLNMTQKLDPTN